MGATPAANGRLRNGAAPPGPSAELLGQADDDALGAAHEAEAVAVPVLSDPADELGAVGPEAGEDVVDVVDGEHDPAYSERVRGRGLARDRRRGVEPRQLDAAVAVRGSHERDVRAHAVEPDDAVRPRPLDRRLALELHAELGEEGLGGLEVVDDDEDAVHA